MTTAEKILKSWWAIFSAILFLNGLGFIYIGIRNNNRNWIIEGIIYEIPWVFGVYFVDTPMSLIYSWICIVDVLVAIVRSVWVAIKLGDVYENEEKYRVQTTIVNNSNVASQNDSFPIGTACCTGIILIFIAYAILSLFNL